MNNKIIIMISLFLLLLAINVFLLANIFLTGNSITASRKEQDKILADLKLLSSVEKKASSLEKLNFDKLINTFSTDSAVPNTSTLKYLLAIYNASGITGYASQIKNQLESTGLFREIKIENMETASESVLEYKTTVNKEVLNKIFQEIKKEIPVFKEKTLPDAENSDLILILGTNR